jgi:predicted TIM-barrel fold metal-dependent hydrolase
VHEDLEVAAQRSDVLATSAWVAKQDPESVASEAEAREQRTLSCHVFVST